MMEPTPSIDDIRQRLAMGAAGYAENYSWKDADALLSALDAASRRVAEKDAETAALLLVADAARQMPRATPAPGGASTEHQFIIEAAVVWNLDRALKALDAANPNHTKQESAP